MRDRMARVHVSDETWSAFRAGLGSTPVSVELGWLVEREVATRRRQAASDAGSAQQAIDDARVVVDELSDMVRRLELAQSRTGSPVVRDDGGALLFDAADG